MGFPRREYWSGLLFSTPGDLPDSGIKPRSPALQVDLYVCRHMFGLPWWLSSKEFAWNSEHLDSIPGWEDPLEKGLATYFSILAWRIPNIQEGRILGTCLLLC